jgi:NADP-dependent 3-hydroxy acid dehydrogenase YdfG
LSVRIDENAANFRLLAAAKAIIEAEAYVVVTGRRQTELDRAKQFLGKNATISAIEARRQK